MRYARSEWVEGLPDPAGVMNHFQLKFWETGVSGDGTLVISEMTSRSIRGHLM